MKKEKQLISKLDRAFINDMYQFISMNHVATIIALRQSLSILDNIAMLTIRSFRSDETWDNTIKEAINKEVLEYNHMGRIERIIIAKMFAEMMAAFEDLGAFCFAIKHRDAEGILSRYMRSQSSEVACLFDKILNYDIPNHSEITLDAILSLPLIVNLENSLEIEVFDALRYNYVNIPKQLHQFAQWYRVKRYDLEKVQPKNASMNKEENTFNVITAIILPNEAPKNTSLTSDVFNKIKHRFMVPDNLSAYASLHEGYNIEYVLLSQGPEFVQRMINNTISVARTMSDLASMLLKLDELGFIDTKHTKSKKVPML